MNRTLALLFTTLLIDMIGIGMVIPLISIIFTDPTSSSFLLANFSSDYWYIIAGLTLGLYGVVQFIAAPILGELSDIYGRKKLLATGVGVLALSQIMFGLGILMGSLTVVIISRAIGGFAGANFSIVQATIADVTKPEDRAKNFGMIGAAFGIGFILGPVLGGYIASASGSAALPFFVAGVFGVINFILVTTFLKETNKFLKEKVKITFSKGLKNIKSAFTDTEASHLYISSFLYMLGFACFTSFSGIYLVHKYSLSEAALGTYFGAVGIWIVITQVVILRFVTKKFTEKKTLSVTLITVGLAIAALPFMPNLTTQYLWLPFIAIPQGLSMASIGALISKSVSPKKQGAALGINGSLGALAQGAIPTVAGVVTAKLGTSSPFIMGGMFIVSAWYILVRSKK